MPKLGKTGGEQVTLLEQALAELQERLDNMRARERAVDKLKAYIERWPMITKADVAAVARGMPKVRDPADFKKAAKRKGGGPGKLRTADLKPAVGKVGKAVRAARVKANLSTSKLGEMIGSGSGYISQIERGVSNLSDRKAERVAKVLKIPLASIRPNGHDATA